MSKHKAISKPTSSNSTFRQVSALFWPVGGSLLGLVVMPMAIDQYPSFFHENPWILPITVAVVIACWLAPLFFHRRLWRILIWIWGDPSRWRAVRVALSALFTVVLIYAITHGSIALVRYHTKHVAQLIAKKLQPTSERKQSTTPAAVSSQAPVTQTNERSQPLPVSKAAQSHKDLPRKKAILDFTFLPIGENNKSVKEIAVPVNSGAVNVSFSAKSVGALPAKNPEVWIEVCDGCKFAEEPAGTKPAPNDPFARRKHFDVLRPGLYFDPTVLKIIPPGGVSTFTITFKYVCEQCPPIEKQNLQTLKVDVQADTFKFVNNTVVNASAPIPTNVTNAEVRMNDFYQTNSAFQNGGKADRVFMEDNVIHPAPGGNATVVNNLPGGEVTNVIGRRNIVYGVDWWTRFADSVVANSGHKDQIQGLVDQLKAECDRAWRNYSKDQRQQDLDELNTIIEKIMQHVDDEKSFSEELHKTPKFAQ